MVDLVQILLLTIISIITILIVILGIQVFFILSEVRKTVSKTNTILDKAETITDTVKTPLSAISALALSIKSSSFLSIAKFVRNLLDHQKQEKDEKHEHGK